jgi:DNA-binding CsgD family transcriptional regulator
MGRGRIGHREGKMPPLDEQLRELGLSTDAASAYRYLLSVGPTNARTVESEFGWAPARCEAVLGELESLALALREQECVRPLDPDTGLRALSDRIRIRVDMAVEQAVVAYAAYRRNHNTWGSRNIIEILEGADTQRAWTEIEAGARSHVAVFDTPPYGGPLANPIEIDNLRRSVSYRALYAQAAVEDPDRFQTNIMPCIKAGEVARVLPKMPVKMLLVDDRVALIGLTSHHVDRHHTALLIHESSVLPALTELFELCWKSATPLGGDDYSVEVLQPIDRLVLRHLAAGLPDDSVARNLGISKRTMTRYVERLMRLAGADSRFQLAIYAQSHGWIG